VTWIVLAFSNKLVKAVKRAMLIDRAFLFAGAAAAGTHTFVPVEHLALVLQVFAATVCVLLAIFWREAAIKAKLVGLQLKYFLSCRAPSLLDWAVAQYEVGELLKLEEVRDIRRPACCPASQPASPPFLLVVVHRVYYIRV
jgi:hypothetical protein